MDFKDTILISHFKSPGGPWELWYSSIYRAWAKADTYISGFFCNKWINCLLTDISIRLNYASFSWWASEGKGIIFPFCSWKTKVMSGGKRSLVFKGNYVSSGISLKFKDCCVLSKDTQVKNSWLKKAGTCYLLKFFSISAVDSLSQLFVIKSRIQLHK